jgi:transcriptional regulator with XRE-family HTH domain
MESHHNLPNVVGHLIRAARNARGVSQGEVGAEIGVTVQAISQWERGETKPSGINLIKLAALFGINFPTAENVLVQNIFPDREVSAPSIKLSELREQVEEIADLLHALDKIGDGIGDSDGYAVSAVALNARSIAGNVLCSLRVMEGKR